MNLTWRQKAALLGILQDERTIAAQDYHGGDSLEYMQRGNYRLKIKRAKAGYVPINLAGWLGFPPSNGDVVMFCRAHERLERMGLIERVSMSGGRRTTHLKLTVAGRGMAEQLLAEEYGLDGDSTIDWANAEFMPIEMPPETAAPVKEGE